jgi:eukaryotic-like serine/threonine-protein kinase
MHGLLASGNVVGWQLLPAMPMPELTPGTILAGKYRIDRVIGEGGMGVVLAAEHRALGRAVAIKLLHVEADDELIARFQREARVAASLASVHVPQVFDIDRLPSGEPYLVMELLHGLDLAQLLERRKRLAAEEAVDYLLQACEALARAEGQGIVHRDLKPANLFLASTGGGGAVVKVLDFGLAKLAAELDSPQHVALTRTGSFFGSPAYMSPEQWMSPKSADARSDVWSLGCILYELLTGQVPFGGSNLGDLFRAALEARPPSPRALGVEIPPMLDALIMRCLEKEPARRYSGATELGQALRATLPAADTSRSIPLGSAPTVAGSSIPIPLGSAPTLASSSVPAAWAPTLASSSRGPEPVAAPAWPQALPGVFPARPARRRLAVWVVLALGLLALGLVAIFLVASPRARSVLDIGPRRGLPKWVDRPASELPVVDESGPAPSLPAIVENPRPTLTKLLDAAAQPSELLWVQFATATATLATPAAGDGGSVESWIHVPAASVSPIKSRYAKTRWETELQPFPLRELSVKPLPKMVRHALRQAAKRESPNVAATFSHPTGGDFVWLVTVFDQTGGHAETMVYDREGVFLGTAKMEELIHSAK